MIIEKNLSDKTNDYNQAIESLREELEAVNFYRQRAETCTDTELKSILIHNMNEEKEHAVMIIEWLRRNDVDFEKEVHDYINTDVPLGNHG